MRRYGVQYFVFSGFLLSCEQSEKQEQEEAPDSSELDEEEDTVVDSEDTADNIEQPETGDPDDDKLDMCDLQELEPESKELPAIVSEAAQLLLLAGEGESYLLSKEVDAEGWFVLEVPSWMCSVHMITEENVLIELEDSPDWEHGETMTVLEECTEDGLYHSSWIFHAWGSYTVHVQAPEQSEVWLAIMMTEGP